MNESKIMSRGLIATRLLADDEFMAFWDDLKSDIQTASFSRPDTDIAQRDSVYFQLKGIHDVLGILEQYSKAAEAIAKSYSETDTTYDD